LFIDMAVRRDRILVGLPLKAGPLDEFEVRAL